MTKLLSIKDLSVSFGQGERAVKAVKNISLDIEKGEVVALVGESGSGKSVSALSVMQLLPYPLAHHPSGKILFNGEDIMGVSEGKMRDLRGDRISMIFQEPTNSLNPLQSVEKQISEVLHLQKRLSAWECQTRVRELLDLVGMSDAKQRLQAFYDGTLKIRPMGKPVYQPTGREKVAQRPPEWEQPVQHQLLEKPEEYE